MICHSILFLHFSLYGCIRHVDDLPDLKKSLCQSRKWAVFWLRWYCYDCLLPSLTRSSHVMLSEKFVPNDQNVYLFLQYFLLRYNCPSLRSIYLYSRFQICILLKMAVLFCDTAMRNQMGTVWEEKRRNETKMRSLAEPICWQYSLYYNFSWIFT